MTMLIVTTLGTLMATYTRGTPAGDGNSGIPHNSAVFWLE